MGAIAALGIAVWRPALVDTFFQRIVYMIDAMPLVRGRLLFGNGFGSWRVLQYGVQCTEYTVTFLHNGILQMLIENGLVFTLVFLALTVYSVVNAIRTERYSLAAMTSVILIHALIDCDLSFGVTLCLLGLSVGASLPRKDTVKSGARILNCLLIAVVCVSSVYMLTEYTLRTSFEQAYLQNDFPEAARRAARLEKICPLDAQLKASQAALEEKTIGDTEKTKAKLAAAVALSPHDPEIHEGYMYYCLNDGALAQLCMQHVNLAPKQERTYVFLNTYLSEAEQRGFLTASERAQIQAQLESRRQEESVIDRNKLLYQLVQNGK